MKVFLIIVALFALGAFMAAIGVLISTGITASRRTEKIGEIISNIGMWICIVVVFVGLVELPVLCVIFS